MGAYRRPGRRLELRRFLRRRQQTRRGDSKRPYLPFHRLRRELAGYARPDRGSDRLCRLDSGRKTLLAAGAVSNSGSVYYSGVLYISTNSGVTWVPTGPSGVAYQWMAVASSADGSTLGAVPGGNAVCRSADAGATWTTAVLTNSTDVWSRSLSISADGTKWLASLSSTVFQSTSSGLDWVAASLQPDVLRFYRCVSCSAQGETFVAAQDFWAVYYSHDSGVSWAFTNVWPSWWGGVACSADGRKIVAVGCDDRALVSPDSGATWARMKVPDGCWSAVACSADGANVVAVMNGGGIYRWRSTPQPILHAARSGGNLVLSWTVPSLPFVLQQTPDVLAQGWSDVTNAPALNHSNLRNEVTLSAPAAAVFYRLVSR